MNKRISYSAVVLDEKSHSKLLGNFGHLIPDDFETIAHHMTINMGELDSSMKNMIGNPVTLKVIKIGVSDMAIAVEVTGFYSKNKIPHITLAVNRKEGAKPFMSNKIENWQEVDNKITLIGKVEEIPW